MQELAARGAVVDMTTVADELRRRQQLDAAGGMVKLSQLTDPLTACIEAHLRGYVDRVLDYGLKRESTRWATEYLTKAKNGSGAQQLIDQVSAHLTALRNRPIGTPRTPELVDIPGGVLVTWPRSEVAMRFDTARDERDGHTAEAGVYIGERLLAFGKVTLASLQSRKYLASAIEHLAPFSTWPQLIQEASHLVLEHVKAGSPPVVLEAKPPTADRYLVRDFLVADEPTLLYGPGGACKSLTALLLEMAMATGHALAGFTPTRIHKVGILDWESTKDTHGGRVWGLAKGLGIAPPELVYFAMDRPLADDIRRIARECRQRRLEALVVDSAAYACDGPPEDAHSATAFFTALRSLRVTTVVIAHMSKAAIDAAEGKPFGSIYWENAPRLTWELRPDGRRDTGSLVRRQIGLYNRKSNAEYFADRALEYQFDTSSKIITPRAIAMNHADPGLVARGLSQGQLVLRALTHEPMTAEALHDATGIATRTLYEVCNRLVAEHLITRVKDAKPAQWARLTTGESTS
jgi:hypothetical protein